MMDWLMDQHVQFKRAIQAVGGRVFCLSGLPMSLAAKRWSRLWLQQRDARHSENDGQLEAPGKIETEAMDLRVNLTRLDD